jgi:arginine exporter protein ArgO
MAGRAVVEGLIAGFGIAVPVGAIGVLIVDRAATRGFAQGAAAGTGTALADLTYAVAAVALGTAAARLLPATAPAQAVSAVVLGGVAGWMLRSALLGDEPAESRPRPAALWRITATFLALTIVNPVTVVYFTALVTGLDGTVLRSPTDRALFAVAAFAASLSWQVTLAAAGSVLGHRMTPRSRRVLHAVGAAIVIGLALRMALRVAA